MTSSSALSKRKRVSGNVIPFAESGSSIQKEQALLNRILCEAEEAAVLGAILQDPDLYIQVSGQLQAADFFNEMRGYIWFAFDQLSSRKEGIDIMNVIAELSNQPKCPLKGEALDQYISALISAPSDRNNIESYARRVREAALKIRLLKATYQMREMVFEERDIDALVDGSNRILFEATEQHRAEATNAAAIVSELWDHVESLMASGKSPTIPTGFPEFDSLTTGATPGEVMVLAGSEKQGKTTLLLSWIRNMCKAGKHVLLFTLEMSKTEIMRLLIAMESGIYRDSLKTGQLSKKDWQAFVDASGRISQWPLDIEDQYSALTPIQTRRQIRFHQAQHPVDVVAIDGLWLMDSDDPKMNEPQNRPRAVFFIMRDLTEQAKLFHVPILITHQYRDLTHGIKRVGPPTLYELAESSGVRRNAQMILGLHRTTKKLAGVEIPTTELHILGDRNGRSQGNFITLSYDKTYSCYRESECLPTTPE